jgi:hypothetical protein
VLTIQLRSIVSGVGGGEPIGVLRDVGEHPFFIDFPDRDIADRWDPTIQSRIIETRAIVTVDFTNALAPVLLEMHDRPVRDAASLADAVRFLRRKHPGREDGIRVAELLIEWAEKHPKSAWSVTVDSDAEAEILRARSLNAQVAATADAPRMKPPRIRLVERDGKLREVMVDEAEVDEPKRHDPDECTIAGCGPCNRVTEADLQLETRTPGHGGSGRTGRAKPMPAMGAGDAVNVVVHDVKTRNVFEAEDWEAAEARQMEAEAKTGKPSRKRVGKPGWFTKILERREEMRIPKTDVDKAIELKERAETEAPAVRRGRPPKGEVARMRVETRIEPDDVLAIGSTGMTYGEVLAEVADCVRNGRPWGGGGQGRQRGAA